MATDDPNDRWRPYPEPPESNLDGIRAAVAHLDGLEYLSPKELMSRAGFPVDSISMESPPCAVGPKKER